MLKFTVFALLVACCISAHVTSCGTDVFATSIICTGPQGSVSASCPRDNCSIVAPNDMATRCVFYEWGMVVMNSTYDLGLSNMKSHLKIGNTTYVLELR